MDPARWVAMTLAAALDGWLPSCSGSPAALQGRDPARRQAPTPTGEPNHLADLESGDFESHITKPGRATAPRVGNSLLSNGQGQLLPPPMLVFVPARDSTVILQGAAKADQDEEGSQTHQDEGRCRSAWTRIGSDPPARLGRIPADHQPSSPERRGPMPRLRTMLLTLAVAALLLVGTDPAPRSPVSP
jgi:hypothetical protein